MVYRARESSRPQPVFVYLHGGGFRIGSHRSNDRQMREIAAAWGGTVVSADYVHVPEHTFPAPVEETTALLRWLHEHGADWGIDGGRIACGGASAGANVSFGAAVGLGRVAWLQAAVGIVGAFSGDTGTESMRRWGDGNVYPDRAGVPGTFEAYVPPPAQRNDPRVALLEADPALLPPTFLAAAACDVFLDASVRLARRLEDAGRLHALKVYPGMSHLFFGYSRSVDGAAECARDIAAFLSQRLPV
nr:alpha/beta hydrolase fold domain-containing protein [Ramlibacter aurantiacus]